MVTQEQYSLFYDVYVDFPPTVFDQVLFSKQGM